MSIVGTRPPLISETNLYEPHHKARLAIKPGISFTSRLARRRMFPSSCMLIRKQSCVHSKAASGFALPANW